ncbi:MAG TPA: EboA domain-containing protein [Planctomycetota bacterium]|nr:EboA domain-containing protein [Planctomycetota bacterium]
MAVATIGLIDTWLAARLKPEAHAWFDAQVARVAGRAGAERAKALFMAWSAAGRHVGKADLALEPGDLARASQARPGWSPARWSVDQLARARLLLALPADDLAWLATLDRLCAAADLAELVAFYQALPLLPHPERLRARAAEGVRSNIRAVFDAVALDNPYPAERLDEGAFNQLVLKALFVGAPLGRVIGVDGRGNAALMRTLIDFAHERRAAGRAVPIDLWRLVGAHADERALADLAALLSSDEPAERQAAALALHACPDPAARVALDRSPEARRALASGALSWDSLVHPAR